MANDTNGNRKKLASLLAAPAFTVLAGLLAGAVGVWAQSQVTRSEIADHDRRIHELEESGRESGSDVSRMMLDVAVLKERVDTIKQDTADIKLKLDAIIDEQLRAARNRSAR